MSSYLVRMLYTLSQMGDKTPDILRTTCPGRAERNDCLCVLHLARSERAPELGRWNG